MSETYKITRADDLVQEEYRKLYPGEHPSREQLTKESRSVAEAVKSNATDCMADAEVQVRLHELGFTGVFLNAPRELIEELGLCELLDRVNFDLASEFDARMHEYRERTRNGAESR